MSDAYERQRLLAYQTLTKYPQFLHNAADLARHTGIPGRSARRYVQQFEEGTLLRFDVPDEEVYGGEYVPAPVRKFTGFWKLDGDFAVFNDVHIPTTNWDFAEKAIEVSCRLLKRPRKLLIAGDLVNGDALSKWEDIIPSIPLADELEYGTQYLHHLSKFFDELFFFRGNHEDRILKPLRGQLHAPQFLRMLSDNTKVHFSMYSYATVKSGKQMWRITHQKGYSRNPLSVARRLAAKTHMNVICAHQHHSATGRSECNQYTCIDSGGLHDHEKMLYVMLDDNTSPVMNNGFVILKNGTGTLFTPYETLTDIGVLCP